MGRIHSPSTGRPKTIVHPKNATKTSNTAYKWSGRHRRILDDAASAFPSAKPAMKLERINAAAQTELPNAKPLRRSQRTSKISAPIPDRNRIPERALTRSAMERFVDPSRSVCTRVLNLRASVFAIDLFEFC